MDKITIRIKLYYDLVLSVVDLAPFNSDLEKKLLVAFKTKNYMYQHLLAEYKQLLLQTAINIIEHDDTLQPFYSSYNGKIDMIESNAGSLELIIENEVSSFNLTEFKQTAKVMYQEKAQMLQTSSTYIVRFNNIDVSINGLSVLKKIELI